MTSEEMQEHVRTVTRQEIHKVMNPHLDKKEEPSEEPPTQEDDVE